MNDIFVDPQAEAAKEQGMIDKTDPNNPVYTIRYNGQDHKVSMLAVQPDKRDWMAGNLNTMFKNIIASAEAVGDNKRQKLIRTALNLR